MSLMKKAIGGSIHRIREFELEKVNLADEFDILQIVGEGWFGKILLTEHRSTQTEMVLKALPKAYTGITDFYREFHYGLHLSAHRNIITTYDVAFETAGFYVFSQEYAPLGDLTSNVTETGLGELHAKRVARQLAAAVHHIHSRELVHRDIKLDNILVFRSDFSRIKLCDFGETRKTNTIVRRHNEWLPYSPPEVLQIETDETYKALTSHDVWQFGIVLFVCLTGCIPWQKAAMDDRRYTRYLNWHTATLNIAKKPKLFQLISSRAQRMFKRLLEPKVEKRPVSVLEVNKYLEDRWLAKLGAEKALTGGADERDELSPSMYSFHSSLEEKNQLLYTLTQYGIETTVDRTRKKDRIREWIESSAIIEENEDESDAEDMDRFNVISDNDEDASMKGRHFPERRPSARKLVEPSSTPSPSHKTAQPTTDRSSSTAQTTKNGTSGKTRRANTIISSNHRTARTMRRMERRNPFAPQVAHERHNIARFASFPNGDPSLGITREADGSRTADDALKMAELEKEQIFIRSAGSINDMAAGTSGKTVNTVTMAKQWEQSRNSNMATNIYNPENGSSKVGNFEKSDIGNNRSSQNQEIVRRNADERGDEASGYSKDETIDRSPQAPNRKHRSQTAPFPAVNQQTGQSRMESLARGTRSTVAPTNVPRTTNDHNPIVNAQLITKINSNNNNNNYNSNDNNIITNDVKNDGNLPLTMSVASHLVMQSFNALQAMNTVPMASPASSRPHNLRNDEKSVVARDVGNVTSGKDAYEHYGLAQRAVGHNRTDLPRQGSTGSGSRSVSN